MTGALSVAIQAPYADVATGFAAAFVVEIIGRVSGSAWDFGDGTVVSNRPYASHAWTNAGNYAVVLRAYNDMYPAGEAPRRRCWILKSVTGAAKARRIINKQRQ